MARVLMQLREMKKQQRREQGLETDSEEEASPAKRLGKLASLFKQSAKVEDKSPNKFKLKSVQSLKEQTAEALMKVGSVCLRGNHKTLKQYKKPIRLITKQFEEEQKEGNSPRDVKTMFGN